jgi:CMP-N,N'-diacetyllegionaminic acid synthase
MAKSKRQNLLIVIPSRGGSKGLPGKNIKPLGGMPLLGWTVTAIKQSGLSPAATILSTDSDEIAAIGQELGLTVPFLRPNDLATDEAVAVDVALHAIDWFESEYGTAPEFIMWLQPTSPFRPPEKILEAFRLLIEHQADAVLGVKSIHRTLQTLFHRNPDNLLTPLLTGDTVTTRRQEVNPIYTPNGAMYLLRSEVLRSEKSFFPSRSLPLIMDKIESLDIDNPIDWDLAESIVSAGKTWRNGR